MENITSRYVDGGDQASPRSENALPGRVEAALEEIYRKHNRGPINDETRQILSLIPEELASDTLRKVFKSQYVVSLDGFIKYLLDQATNGSPQLSSGAYPAQSPAAKYRLREETSLDSEDPPPKSFQRQGNGESLPIPPQLLALAELEFKKAFLLLSYIPGKTLPQVITADEIRQWKDLPMVAYEPAVWDRLGRLYCSPTDRRVSLEWDSGKTHYYYQCHVALDGSYTFKGPLLDEHTGTHLHKVLGDDNVLTVKFADVPKNYSNERYSTCKAIAKNGIMVGLCRYHLFVFKDGGKEEKKKKDFSTNGVKCYLIRTDSNDLGNPYIFSGKSIYEVLILYVSIM